VLSIEKEITPMLRPDINTCNLKNKKLRLRVSEKQGILDWADESKSTRV
jgi:hypothetical protein